MYNYESLRSKFQSLTTMPKKLEQKWQFKKKGENIKKASELWRYKYMT